MTGLVSIPTALQILYVRQSIPINYTPEQLQVVASGLPVDPIGYVRLTALDAYSDKLREAIHMRKPTKGQQQIINSIPEEERQRRAWIKYQLELAGYTLSSLASEYGVSRHATKLALDRPYPRMEEAIAGKIGIHPMYIWPERYNDDGTTNRVLGRPRKH